MSKRQKPDQNELFEKLAIDFRELVNDKSSLRNSLEHFLNNLIDEMSVGIIFDEHRKFKTDAYNLEADDGVEDKDSSDTDIFSQLTKKKHRVVCICPYCDRAAAATGFASHLDKCMGLGRLRNSCRRAASNSKDRGDKTLYSGLTSDDDDDDVDWNYTERKRSKRKDKNGSKKSKGTPKKNQEPEPGEQLNVDIEGDDEELSNLRDMLHLQDQHSNSSSPAGGSSSSGTKRNKSKKKSKQKDRNSPCTSLSMD